MDDIILVEWLYADGDFLLFLCRATVFLFSLNVFALIMYIIKGAVRSCG